MVIIQAIGCEHSPYEDPPHMGEVVFSSGVFIGDAEQMVRIEYAACSACLPSKYEAQNQAETFCREAFAHMLRRR